MSRKSKRQVRKSRKTGRSGRMASVSGDGNRKFDRDFNPDYSYVIKDLKRIGALASTFIVIIIVLSFFLR